MQSGLCMAFGLQVQICFSVKYTPFGFKHSHHLKKNNNIHHSDKRLALVYPSPVKFVLEKFLRFARCWTCILSSWFKSNTETDPYISAKATYSFFAFQDVDLNHFRIGKIEGFEVLKKVKVRLLRSALLLSQNSSLTAA